MKRKHPGDNRSHEQRIEDQEQSALSGVWKASTWAWLIIAVAAAFGVWYFVIR